MNRRDFLRRSAIIAAGAIAADQIELLEKLGPRRLFALGAPASLRFDNVVGLMLTRPGIVTVRINGGAPVSWDTRLQTMPLRGSIEILPMGTTAGIQGVVQHRGNDFTLLPESFRS